jgi:hypothetical protein
MCAAYLVLVKQTLPSLIWHILCVLIYFIFFVAGPGVLHWFQDPFVWETLGLSMEDMWGVFHWKENTKRALPPWLQLFSHPAREGPGWAAVLRGLILLSVVEQISSKLPIHIKPKYRYGRAKGLLFSFLAMLCIILSRRIFKNEIIAVTSVAHTCNASYSRSRDQEEPGSKPAQGK